jgi:hypothetical protein
MGGALSGGSAAANDKNLVFNGDFELPSPQSPPPGWAMWGAEKFKVPAHFTRDATQPHNGQRMRMSRAKAQRTQRRYLSKTLCALCVLARNNADKPGRSLFGVTAYESIRPFVDAPSPGFFPTSLQPRSAD